MKLRLEATPDELREKSGSLLKALHAAVVEVDPVAAEPLEKALPRKEPELKYRVLRELKDRTSAEYERILKNMTKEIGKVLDRGPIQKGISDMGRDLADGVKAVFTVDPDDLSKGWYCGHCGAVSPGDQCEHVQKVAARRERMKKAVEVPGADWVEMDERAGEALWGDLEKAGTRPHKYIRRVPYMVGGKQRYRYYYRESAAARAAQVGEEIRLGDQMVRVVKIHDNGDISIQDVGADSDKKVIVTERVKADAWTERLAGHYGEKFYEQAEKRARQAVNAVLRHVPRKMLADLRGDTDEARLEDLRARVPEVYEKLQKSFQRAGVNPFEAKRILKNSLERRGWKPEARAAVIGNVLTLEGARLIRRHREVMDAAENLAGGAQVGAGHAEAAVRLAQSNITQVAKRAESELIRLDKLVRAAREDPTDMGKKAAVLAGSIAAKAVTQLNALATAFPGLVDRAVPVARDTMLKVPSVAPTPPKKVGATASTYVAGEGGAPVALKTQYVLKEAEEVIPSHNPVTFSKNPDYPEDLQERAYHRDKAEQRKVITNASRMATAFVANTNVDAVNGPPIVMKSGVVLGGNSRTMSMQRIYGDEAMADKAEEMKQYLRDHAYEFGLNTEDIDAMKNPILVREVDIPDKSLENLQVMVRAMNESFIQAMDPRTMQVAMGRRLSERTLELLAETMEDEETLAAYLDTSRARPFIQSLHKAGIIDQRNENQYMKKGRLNADGKVMVARVLAGRILDDADMLSDTPHHLVESIAKAVPYLVKAAGSGTGYDLRGTVHLALDAYNELKHLESEGMVEFKLDKTLNDERLRKVLANLVAAYRTDLQEDHPIMGDARAQAVLEVFIRRSGSKKLPNVFREFARLAGENREDQPTLGAVAEVYTSEQVFRLAIQAAIDREAREAAEAAAKRAETARRKKEKEAAQDLFGKADAKAEYSAPLIRDHTKPVADKDDLAYSRVKVVLQGKGYTGTDFEEGGPLWGWSVNQLIDLARNKRMD